MSTLLPIDAIKKPLLDALSSHNTLVLMAPPGAGKSTRIPLWLLASAQFSNQKIYLLQPRRIAAKNIACFLAEQLGEKVGQTVGYRLRNETKVSSYTRLEVITEGILTQIIQHDPELSDCGLIVLDEFHERSLHGDLAFALARDIQQGLREDLTLLLMSATLATKTLLEKLPDAIALESEGRSFPVQIDYIPNVSTLLTSKSSLNQSASNNANKWRVHALNVVKKYGREHNGSILVFLPGVADIRYFEASLKDVLPLTMQLSPLYGELSIAQQQQAISPAKPGVNKLVLATNIAETSLTIEGVNLVIDCGLEKVARYNVQSMTNQLQQQAISKASAVQRAGRAGRIMPGRCIRLYSREDYERRIEHNTSEIQQADLLPLLIESARWGVNKLSDLPLLEYPVLAKEKLAWQELQTLSLVDQKNRLTRHGITVAKLACHPRFAHMIIMAQHLESTKNVRSLTVLACVLAAVLEERDIYQGEHAKNHCDICHRLSDIIEKKSKYQSIGRRVLQQAHQLAKAVKIQMASSFPLQYTGLLLALAYPERLAKYRGRAGEYQASNGKGLSMSDEDVMLGEEYIVAAQIGHFRTLGQSVDKGNNRNVLQIKLAAPVNITTLIDWKLVELSHKLHLTYDDKQSRIIAKQQKKINALVIEEVSVSQQLTTTQIADMWVQQVFNQGLQMLPFSEQDHALLARWRWLNRYQSQLRLPDVSEQSLLNSLDIWLAPFVGQSRTKAQLGKCDFSNMLLSLLDYSQQQLLNKMAPPFYKGPTGRRCPIRYDQEKSPTVSVPMQELYGVKSTPSVGDVGNQQGISLIIELLSPAKRPIQVTQDLVVFWQGSYKIVQKDMKSQYPKHYWPDDPANAQPTSKTKRHIKL